MWAFVTDTTWGVRATIGAAIGAMILGGIPALFQWSYHREGAQAADAPGTTTVPPRASGDDNTYFGVAPAPGPTGSRNTIIIPDAQGRVPTGAFGAGAQAAPGSTAIGSGAKAGPQSVVIGAHD
jgi:hypothetical protein